MSLYIRAMHRESSIGIATGYGLDGPRLIPTASILALISTQPPIQWIPGALFPGIERQGREADHSLPSSADVKNGAAISPLPPYVFMA
jgi:hypothetical protein